MTTNRRILGNITSLFSAQVVTLSAGLATTAYLARALGVDGFGILGFGLAFVSYFGLVCNLGADGYGMREISRQPDRAPEFARQVISLRFYLAVVLYLLFAAVTWVIDQPEPVKIVMWIQGGTLFVTALTFDFAFHALEKMNIQALRQIGAGLLYLVLVVLFVSGIEDLYTVAALSVGAQGLAMLWMLVQFRRTVGPVSLRLGLAEAKHVARISVPLMMTAVMTTIYYNLDIIMLQFLRDQTDVGLYVSAFRVATLATIGGEVVRQSLMPSMHRAVTDTEEQRRQGARLAQAVMMVGAPMAVMGFLYAPEILGVIFGQAFRPAASALAILMVAVSAQYVTFVYASKLYAWNHDRAQFAASGAGAGLNIVLNVLLIPDYGIEGAAVATLASHVVVMAFMVLFLARHDRPLSIVPILKVMVLAVIAGAVTWVFAGLLRPSSDLLALIAGAAVYGLAYGLMLVAFGLLNKEIIKALLRR